MNVLSFSMDGIIANVLFFIPFFSVGDRGVGKQGYCFEISIGVWLNELPTNTVIGYMLQTVNKAVCFVSRSFCLFFLLARYRGLFFFCFFFCKRAHKQVKGKIGCIAYLGLTFRHKHSFSC